MDISSQNEISQMFKEASDLKAREEEILSDVCQLTGFAPKKLLSWSSWWGSSQIGAFHYEGKFQNKEAVLKVQGVKPQASEISMLQSFNATNKSAVIRLPALYACIPWDDRKRYEVLIMEKVDGKKIISQPTTAEEINFFFELYQDYRRNCINSPWVEKPRKSIGEGLEQNFEKWQEARKQIYPNHPFTKPQDVGLIQHSLTALRAGYKGVEPEFMHGHFSADDLYQVDDRVVLLSNLYWSWRPPLYDAIFAYHWYIYRFANYKDGVTPEQIELQRELWLSHIYDLPQSQGENKRLLEMALLERATAGLTLDALTVGTDKPIAEYVVQKTRENLENLLGKIS